MLAPPDWSNAYRFFWVLLDLTSMAVLDARSPRFRSGGDRGPDIDPPSRTSPGAGPAPNPGGFAGPFDSPSESTSTSSTTRSPSSTGVSPGGFGVGSDSASSATSSPTPHPTSTGVSPGGSVSSSASSGGGSSRSGGGRGNGLSPAAIIGIVVGVVLFIFLSSLIHFWSRGKHRHTKLRGLKTHGLRRCVENPLTEGHRKEALIRPPLTLPPRASPLEERQGDHRPVHHNLALEALPQTEGPRRA